MNKLSIAAGLLAAAFMTTVAVNGVEAKPPQKTITQTELKQMLHAPVVTVALVSNYSNQPLETMNFRNSKDLRAYLQTAMNADNVKERFKDNNIPFVEKPGGNYSSTLQDTRITKSSHAHFEINGNFKEGDSARLQKWDLSGLDLSRSLIRNIDLTGVNLAGSTLDGSYLENVMLAGIYAPDTSWKNVDFGENVKGSGCVDGVTTVLSNADFTGSPFKSMNWGKAIMNGATLPATITDTNFEGADLRGADGSRTRFETSYFAYVNIAGANLTSSTFHDMGPMLENTFDENTKVAWAKFTGNSVPQLDLVKHKEAQEQGLPVPKVSTPAPHHH